MTSAAFDAECERSLLEHMMLCMYEHGMSSTNPLHRLVHERFHELARKHSAVMAFVWIPLQDGEVYRAGLLPMDFDQHGEITEERLIGITWRVAMARRMLNASGPMVPFNFFH